MSVFRCSKCGRTCAGEELYICGECGAFLCGNCVHSAGELCPNCYGKANKLS
ncbi:MAG TPA: hypothetical protein H9729_03490 [Candidatus Borkfalkia excrementigallinarum]|uniref:Uncharacterized protein n=1 Tax=Candidatus Borkfalkia excrementigallinarum TaxID=2838506 RepID=A0A9D1ZUI3_9FIRM|nr:hypothetical protein [Candidatus Borkfalkia excrementigallinarum]